MKRRHTTTRVVQRLLVLVVGLIAGLVLAEGLARLLAPQWQPAWAERATFWRHDALLGWAQRAGQRGVFSGPGFRTEVAINSRGLRDRERDWARAPGQRRVLLLGDSFGWGYGVARESCLAARLEVTVPRLEVVNGSVSGYGTAQELLWYRVEGRLYRPDCVLLLVSDNDVNDNCGPSIYWYRKPYFTLEEGSLVLHGVPVKPPTVLERVRIWALGRTYLGAGLRALWWRLRGGTVTAPERAGAEQSGRRRAAPERAGAEQQREPPRAAPDSACFQVTRALLHELGAHARADGARLAVALVPMPAPLADWWVAAAQDEGLPVLDLRRRVPTSGDVLLPGDQHWNARGHGLAAAAAAPFLDSLLTGPANAH